MKTYEHFFEALSQKESSNNYKAVQKKYGYLGKYQMGEAALIDCGYYKRDGKISNSFRNGFWTGKDNVKSKDDFLNNPVAQEKAIRLYMEIQWGYILSKNLDRFVGESRDGLVFTVSGILAGAHLGGHGHLEAYLKKGVLIPDGNKVFVTEYIKNFAGYETPFEKRKRIINVERNKKGEIIGYMIETLGRVSKEEVISLVRAKKLDAVIIKNKQGEYIRTSPDKKWDNNIEMM